MKYLLSPPHLYFPILIGVFLITTLGNHPIHAQQSILLPTDENSSIRQHLSQTDTTGWLYFAEDIAPTQEEFWEGYAPELFLGNSDQAKTIRVETDEIGISHLRFQQLYQGYPVEGSEVSLHSREGKIFMLHGKWLPEININLDIHLDEAHALEAALTEIAADLYIWEDQEAEAEWKERHENPEATRYPKGELLISRKYEQLQEGQANEIHRLCWYFEVAALSPYESWGIYIDATDGTLFKQKDLHSYCNNPAAGTCTTLYNGQQNISVRERNWPYNDFTLQDCNREIEVRLWTNINSSSRVTNNSANWGTNDQIETSAMWAAQQSWEYISSTHNYQGWENTSSFNHKIFAQSLEGTTFDKADEEMHISTNSLGNHLVTLDIVGHEWIHGVDHFNANLENEREPGAVAEGYGDIFGTLTERFALNGSGWNWTLGEDAGEIKYNIQHPLSYQLPNVVWGGHYFNPHPSTCPTPSPTNDHCGVHQNASITSLAFFLMSQGGNQNGGVSVPAIGIDKAAAIAFRALRHYLQPLSGFVDTRNAWIQSARDLYGTCSLEELATQRGWHAVGVGNSPSTHCVNISGPSKICIDIPYQPVFTAKSVSAASHTWSVPNGWSVQYSGSGNKNMTVTNIAPWAAPFATIAVTSTWNGMSAYNSKSVSVISCGQYRIAGSDKVDIIIMPQPASDYIQIKADESLFPAHCALYDMMGRELWRTEVHDASQKLSLQALSTGVYICKLRDSQGHMHSQSLQIIQN